MITTRWLSKVSQNFMESVIVWPLSILEMYELIKNKSLQNMHFYSFPGHLLNSPVITSPDLVSTVFTPTSNPGAPIPNPKLLD